jgi:adenosylhomocysteine nucleosidase
MVAALQTTSMTLDIKPCHYGIVFALGIESGGLEDLLSGAIRIRGSGFWIKEGGLKGRRVVIIRSGAGLENAAQATEILIAGHRPELILSAGFAGGLSPALNRHDILLADSVICGTDFKSVLPIPNPQSLIPNYPTDWPGLHTGILLTLDRVIHDPREKQSLHQQYQALAVDMETFAVAEVCRRRNVPLCAVRIIHDAANDALSPDVERLLRQKTEAARLGAALAALWRRPTCIKDLWALKETSLVASNKLAEFIVKLATMP